MNERSSYDLLAIPFVAVDGSLPPLPGDCGEPLVPAGLVPEAILLRPMYFTQKLAGALAETYVRQGVLQRLLKAAAMLPAGHRLVIYDGWRSTRLQQTLFDIEETRVRKAHAGWTDQQVRSETCRHVALPSDDPLCPSGHRTGGAVDLSIADPDGVELWMGTTFDDASGRSATRWFECLLEQHVPLEDRDREALRNRRLLYHAMISAGFVNYADEWWHYDFGNANWARIARATPLYGGAVPAFAWRDGEDWT